MMYVVTLTISASSMQPHKYVVKVEARPASLPIVVLHVPIYTGR
jgi:hypothetical protein